MTNLSETISIKKISETPTLGVFEVSGLYTGYGLTVGNALRRVLLSSLPGAAVTQMKIKGVGHEFSTIPHVLEDAVEIMLNIKRIRFHLYGDEPQTVTVKAKGEKKVTAADIKTTAAVDVVTPEAPIATLTSKSAEFEAEFIVERGLGYVPVESRKMEKLPVGTIALDAIFSPVTKVNFTAENMRVGDRTDYNKLMITIETDGSLSPSEALKRASDTLQEHFVKVAEVEVLAAPVIEKVVVKKTKKKEEDLA